MSLTLVTEMLRGEVKQLAIAKREGGHHQSSPPLSYREASVFDEAAINSQINKSTSGLDLPALANLNMNLGSWEEGGYHTTGKQTTILFLLIY